jgi:hypothetical protein
VSSRCLGSNLTCHWRALAGPDGCFLLGETRKRIENWVRLRARARSDTTLWWPGLLPLSSLIFSDHSTCILITLQCLDLNLDLKLFQPKIKSVASSVKGTPQLHCSLFFFLLLPLKMSPLSWKMEQGQRADSVLSHWTFSFHTHHQNSAVGSVAFVMNNNPYNVVILLPWISETIS